MKIVFMGTPPAAASSLQRLMDDRHEIAAVYTQPDRPSGRGNKVVFSAVKELALANDLEVHQPLKIRTADALETFQAHSADVAVVVAYGRILPDGFLNAFPHGAVNVHFSLLPKYRGAAPVNWAIVNGETITGVTTIKMDAGLDTGDVLVKREAGIGENETAPELMSRLAGLGAEVLSETISNITQIVPVSQNDAEATFAPIMKREDGVIDWGLTAKQISDRVRGFQPFPGSYAFWKGRRVVIWSANTVEIDEAKYAEPGTVVAVDDGSIYVQAGGTPVLRIEELQFEGKRRIPAKDALHGGIFQIGGKFDERIKGS